MSPVLSLATRQICFINAAHSLTHYSLLVLATAVLAITQQDAASFGGEYGPILAIGTAMFVVYGLGALPMGALPAAAVCACARLPAAPSKPTKNIRANVPQCL